MRPENRAVMTTSLIVSCLSLDLINLNLVVFNVLVDHEHTALYDVYIPRQQDFYFGVTRLNSVDCF